MADVRYFYKSKDSKSSTRFFIIFYWFLTTDNIQHFATLSVDSFVYPSIKNTTDLLIKLLVNSGAIEQGKIKEISITNIVELSEKDFTDSIIAVPYVEQAIKFKKITKRDININ